MEIIARRCIVCGEVIGYKHAHTGEDVPCREIDEVIGTTSTICGTCVLKKAVVKLRAKNERQAQIIFWQKEEIDRLKRQIKMLDEAIVNHKNRGKI